MKHVVFGEGLMAPTLSGDKRFTVRKYRPEAHDFKKDDIVIGEFKDGLNILLRITEDTLIRPFRHMRRSKQAAADGGYWFDADYFADLKSYYPDLTWDMLGAVIFYEVLKVEGVPAVQINEHAQ